MESKILIPRIVELVTFGMIEESDPSMSVNEFSLFASPLSGG